MFYHVLQMSAEVFESDVVIVSNDHLGGAPVVSRAELRSVSDRPLDNFLWADVIVNNPYAPRVLVIFIESAVMACQNPRTNAREKESV